jgi:hypothetical protein
MLILLYLPALLGWLVVPLWLKVMLRLYARLVFYLSPFLFLASAFSAALSVLMRAAPSLS